MEAYDHGATEDLRLTACASVTRVIACLMLAGCATGCVAAFDPTPAREPSSMSGPASSFQDQSTRKPASTNLAVADTEETGGETRETAALDSESKYEPLIEPTSLAMGSHGDTASCGTSFLSASHSSGTRPCEASGITLPIERPLMHDVPLRPPLRQTWFHHARLVPLGDLGQLELPDGSVLAHRERVSSRPLRNAYGGFRDQPLLHRDSSRDPFTDSTLPEIGPPPPHHAAKTVAGLLGGVFLGFAAYAFLPSSFTGTTKEGAYEEAWEHFEDAWTKPPVFDKDRAIVNYVGHPYFGMSFYLTQRNVGESPLRSFLFSVAMSTAFEYLVESWAERPSIQDLIVTPIVGSIFGELVFRATLAMRKNGFTTAEKIAVTVLNPLYVLQNGYR
ncbi:MAG: DUF3943 domain-containing protein [Nitrospiraceae bacterium]